MHGAISNTKGALVPAAWYLTGVLAFDEFEPVRLGSLTFTAPVGNALQYLMTFTGASADFGITLVAGVIAGAFVAAAASRSLDVQGFESTALLACGGQQFAQAAGIARRGEIPGGRAPD